jgi:hypothetical protein
MSPHACAPIRAAYSKLNQQPLSRPILARGIICLLAACIVLIILLQQQAGRPHASFVTKHPLNPFVRNGIPSILHKVGLGLGPDSYDKLSVDARALINRTLQENPTYSLEYWNDARAEDFLAAHFSKNVSVAFHAIKAGAFKADLLRYCLMYAIGGVYSDLTQDFHVSLDTVVDRQRDTLVLASDKFFDECGYAFYAVQIAFMAARPGHALFARAIDRIVHHVQTRYYGCNPMDITGPTMFAQVLAASDVSYRMELITTETACTALLMMTTGCDNPSTLSFNGVPYITMKSSFHKKTLNQHCAYDCLWKKRDVYR